MRENGYYSKWLCIDGRIMSSIMRKSFYSEMEKLSVNPESIFVAKKVPVIKPHVAKTAPPVRKMKVHVHTPTFGGRRIIS